MNISTNTTRSIDPRSRGFTLVETLVAIAILMIAIAGPLVIATKGLTAALYSKDQMIASFLAQESMEVVKNIRDNNVVSAADGDNLEAIWLDGMNDCEIEDGNRCDASGMNGTGNQIVSCGDDGCPVYYDEDTGYNTWGVGKRTQFNRQFYLDGVPLSLTDERRVHVIVNWYQGTIPFEIHLTSTIAAALR